MIKVAIFGAGVAGLATAHELSKNSQYDITLYEVNDAVGGLFRSKRANPETNIPSEVSWHGIGNWYENATTMMNEIPYKDGTVYSHTKENYIYFHILPDIEQKFLIEDQFTSGVEYIKFLYLMSKSFVANQRSQNVYSKQLASDVFRSLLNEQSSKNFLSTSGPWIGADWLKVSYHHLGLFFRKLMFPNKDYLTSEKHWRLLPGPSSEVFFDPWVQYLQSKKVKIEYNKSLTKLNFNEQTRLIESAIVTNTTTKNTEEIKADFYVITTSPFSTAAVIKNSSYINDVELNKMSDVIIDGPHTQISFYLAFSEVVKFPSDHYAIILRDSPYNITLTAVEQFWDPVIDLGKNVKSLWTATACVGTRIKGLNGKAADMCTKEEFINEVLNEIRQCQNFQTILKQYNDNKSFDDLKIIDVDVWHEWTFDPIDGIKPQQPKWVTSASNQQFRSKQKTSIPNLFLGGAHTITDADIWSIEGAVESGKRISKMITKEDYQSTDYKPTFIHALSTADDLLYKLNLPNIIDIILIILIISLLIFLIKKMKCSKKRKHRKRRS